MIKYELIPQQLLYEGSYEPENFFEPQALSYELALRVHSKSYLEQILQLTLPAKAQRKIGFPLTQRLVEREFIITKGTVDCCDYALKNGVALNVAGGTHHAYQDHGEGFCLLNDVAVASMYLLDQKMARQILVIDLDVHQGNGTAAIFQSEPRVFTFSMHGRDNYPMHKEKSDHDIELPTGMGDEEYLSILKETLPELLRRVKPDFLFYVSGVDILESDKLGKLSLSLEACKTRDRMVMELAKENALPLVISMGGGYSPKISTIIEAHCNTFRLSKEIFES